VVGSVSQQFNIAEPLEDDLLKTRLWEYLGLTRTYTKRKGKTQHSYQLSCRNTSSTVDANSPTFINAGSSPDLAEPVVLSQIRRGTTVKSLCANVSSELLREFNYALVWGTSAKHSPQRCGLGHTLDDEDVVQIVSKTIKQQQQVHHR
jgi:ribosome-interacting GTPase 1